MQRSTTRQMNMKTTRYLTLALTIVVPCSASAAEVWKSPSLASSNDLRLTGMWGAAQARSAARMAMPPLDKPDFILADLSFTLERRYTNYSGDISGRWIGAAAFLAPLYPKPFAAFPAILAEIPSYQKSDGHFGVDQDLPHIDVAYDARTRELLRFVGLANIRGSNGDNVRARIVFDPAATHPASPQALAVARAEPLDGRCPIP